MALSFLWYPIFRVIFKRSQEESRHLLGPLTKTAVRNDCKPHCGAVLFEGAFPPSSNLTRGRPCPPYQLTSVSDPVSECPLRMFNPCTLVVKKEKAGVTGVSWLITMAITY